MGVGGSSGGRGGKGCRTLTWICFVRHVEYGNGGSVGKFSVNDSIVIGSSQLGEMLMFALLECSNLGSKQFGPSDSASSARVSREYLTSRTAACVRSTMWRGMPWSQDDGRNAQLPRHLYVSD